MDVANAAYLQSLELDYQRPLHDDSAPFQRGRVVDLFTRVCMSGVPAACLRAMTLNIDPAVTAEITKYCANGDQISCRYLAYHSPSEDDPRPSVVDLRRGCEAGLFDECLALTNSESSADVRFGAEMNCLYVRQDCEVAARSYIDDEPRDRTRARFLLELGCQDGSFAMCYELEKLYRKRVLDEAVPGRARELHRYLCDDIWQEQSRWKAELYCNVAR